jgi:hypothetical protein
MEKVMIPVETPGVQLTVHEVLGGIQHDLEDLLALHADLFPQYAYYRPYMQHRAKRPPHVDPRFIEHWWLIRVNGQAAAIRFFKYVPERDCGLALAIGIKPEYRQQTFGLYRRFAEAILFASLQQVRSDAEAAGKPRLAGMAVEIEPYLFSRYFGEYGHVRLPIDYVEPSFTAEAKPFLDSKAELKFRPMTLGILPIDSNRFTPFNEETLNNITFALLVDHYGLPEEHRIVRRALDSIQMALKTEEK